MGKLLKCILLNKDLYILLQIRNDPIDNGSASGWANDEQNLCHRGHRATQQ